ncbi:hypothetical protein KC19_5G173000 [Ceratodon purpureus]|uniref:Protein kinase domain-containing protein n=1 Tax=Ceratodon purpureus TaxID=3225 RepID=A0A8T0I2K1_CERPU|nr:hypothetical protein KC19_5G173000 [Ceratodon purpureus]
MYDASAMEHNEGVDLSQQLSQVCLESPLHHNNSEEDLESQDKFDIRISDDGVNLADQENPSDYICSQDFFCTPDFITPVDQQFSIDLDNKENSNSLRSPSALTPLRLKRPRPDNIHSHSTWLDDSPRDLGQEIIPLSESTIVEETSITSIDKKTQLAEQLAQLSAIPPSSRERLPNMRRRVPSPVCLQNPFLEEDVSLQQKLIAQARMPAPLSGQTSISRYRDDFHEIQEIGHGYFSRVFKVLKRIDGCLYAVKRSQHPLLATSARKQALTEVQALAAVGAHENVVRYYTAWFESDYCYIQTELCDGTVTQLRNSDPSVSLEHSLLEIMRQMASALSVMHAKGLVHLDLKPDNIYVLNGVYKLGDFGRATRADRSMDIEEGDSRYMPLEILNDDYSQLPKVDMFALGATIYELARGSSLPTSGSQFQLLRQGKLTLLPGYSTPFQNILKALMNPTASARPSAAELLKHPIFHRDVPSLPSPTVPDKTTSH